MDPKFILKRNGNGKKTTLPIHKIWQKQTVDAIYRVFGEANGNDRKPNRLKIWLKADPVPVETVGQQAQ